MTSEAGLALQRGAHRPAECRRPVVRGPGDHRHDRRHPACRRDHQGRCGSRRHHRDRHRGDHRSRQPHRRHPDDRAHRDGHRARAAHRAVPRHCCSASCRGWAARHQDAELRDAGHRDPQVRHDRQAAEACPGKRRRGCCPGAANRHPRDAPCLGSGRTGCCRDAAGRGGRPVEHPLDPRHDRTDRRAHAARVRQGSAPWSERPEPRGPGLPETATWAPAPWVRARRVPGPRARGPWGFGQPGQPERPLRGREPPEPQGPWGRAREP